MDLEFNIEGLSDLQKQLEQLPVKVEQRLLRGALRAGTKVMLDQARALVPRDSGALADSLRISTRATRGGNVTAKLVAGGKDAYYAHMVEFGTVAHKIAGPVVLNGQVRRNVQHPGATPKPFMRPAAEAANGESSAAVEAFKAYLVQRLGEVAK